MPTSTSFNGAIAGVSSGAFNLTAAGALRVALVNGYTPDKETDVLWSDISSYEVTGTKYTARGQTLTGVTVTEEPASPWILVTATNPTWEWSTISATGAVVYDRYFGHLIAYVDFGGPVSSQDGHFVIKSFATRGFLKVTGLTVSDLLKVTPRSWLRRAMTSVTDTIGRCLPF